MPPAAGGGAAGAGGGKVTSEYWLPTSLSDSSAEWLRLEPSVLMLRLDKPRRACGEPPWLPPLSSPIAFVRWESSLACSSSLKDMYFDFFWPVKRKPVADAAMAHNAKTATGMPTTGRYDIQLD